MKTMKDRALDFFVNSLASIAILGMAFFVLYMTFVVVTIAKYSFPYLIDMWR